MHLRRSAERDKAMKKEVLRTIEKMLASKIKHFEQFEKLTEMLCGTDFDGLAELIAKRQVEISEIDKCSDSIQSAIESVSSDEQKTIKSIMTLHNQKPSKEFSRLSQLSSQLAGLLDTVAQKDVLAKNRIDAIKDELSAEMLKSGKNRQVLDYFNSFATMSNNGSSFNSVM